MNKPVIAIVPLYDEERDSLWMLPGYMDGVIEAGGIPVMLSLVNDDVSLKETSSTTDTSLSSPEKPLGSLSDSDMVNPLPF